MRGDVGLVIYSHSSPRYVYKTFSTKRRNSRFHVVFLNAQHHQSGVLNFIYLFYFFFIFFFWKTKQRLGSYGIRGPKISARENGRQLSSCVIGEYSACDCKRHRVQYDLRYGDLFYDHAVCRVYKNSLWVLHLDTLRQEEGTRKVRRWTWHNES